MAPQTGSSSRRSRKNDFCQKDSKEEWSASIEELKSAYERIKIDEAMNISQKWILNNNVLSYIGKWINKFRSISNRKIFSVSKFTNKIKELKQRNKDGVFQIFIFLFYQLVTKKKVKKETLEEFGPNIAQVPKNESVLRRNKKNNKLRLKESLNIIFVHFVLIKYFRLNHLKILLQFLLLFFQSQTENSSSKAHFPLQLSFSLIKILVRKQDETPKEFVSLLINFLESIEQIISQAPAKATQSIINAQASQKFNLFSLVDYFKKINSLEDYDRFKSKLISFYSVLFQHNFSYELVQHNFIFLLKNSLLDYTNQNLNEIRKDVLIAHFPIQLLRAFIQKEEDNFKKDPFQFPIEKSPGQISVAKRKDEGMTIFFSVFFQSILGDVPNEEIFLLKFECKKEEERQEITFYLTYQDDSYELNIENNCGRKKKKINTNIFLNEAQSYLLTFCFAGGYKLVIYYPTFVDSKITINKKEIPTKLGNFFSSELFEVKTKPKIDKSCLSYLDISFGRFVFMSLLKSDEVVKKIYDLRGNYSEVDAIVNCSFNEKEKYQSQKNFEVQQEIRENLKRKSVEIFKPERQKKSKEKAKIYDTLHEFLKNRGFSFLCFEMEYYYQVFQRLAKEDKNSEAMKQLLSQIGANFKELFLLVETCLSNILAERVQEEFQLLFYHICFVLEKLVFYQLESEYIFTMIFDNIDKFYLGKYNIHHRHTKITCEIRDFLCSRLLSEKMYQKNDKNLEKLLGKFYLILSSSPSSLISKQNCLKLAKVLRNQEESFSSEYLYKIISKTFRFESNNNITKKDKAFEEQYLEFEKDGVKHFIVDSLPQPKRYLYLLVLVINLFANSPSFKETKSLTPQQSEVIELIMCQFPEDFKPEENIEELIFSNLRNALEKDKKKKELIFLVLYSKNIASFSEARVSKFEKFFFSKNDLNYYFKFVMIYRDFFEFLLSSTAQNNFELNGLLEMWKLFKRIMSRALEKKTEEISRKICQCYFILSKSLLDSYECNMNPVFLKEFNKVCQDIIQAIILSRLAGKVKLNQNEISELTIMMFPFFLAGQVNIISDFFQKIKLSLSGETLENFVVEIGSLVLKVSSTKKSDSLHMKKEKYTYLIKFLKLLEHLSTVKEMKVLFKSNREKSFYASCFIPLFNRLKETYLFFTRIKVSLLDCKENYKAISEIIFDLSMEFLKVSFQDFKDLVQYFETSKKDNSIFNLVGDEYDTKIINLENGVFNIDPKKKISKIFYPLFFYIKFLLFFNLLDNNSKDFMMNQVFYIFDFIKTTFTEGRNKEVLLNCRPKKIENEYSYLFESFYNNDKELLDQDFDLTKTLEKISSNNLEASVKSYSEFHSYNCFILADTPKTKEENSATTGKEKTPILRHGSSKKILPAEGKKIPLPKTDSAHEFQPFNPKKLFVSEFATAFADHYFYDDRFSKIRSTFCLKEKGNFDTKQLDFVSRIRNYSDGLDSPFFLKKYTDFFFNEYLDVTHGYLSEHFDEIKKESIRFHQKFEIIEEEKGEFICELIKPNYIIEGTIKIFNNFLLFSDVDDPESNSIKPEEKNKAAKVFGSISSDIKKKKKKLFISFDQILSITAKRFLYMWQAGEIYLKNGKSFFFNLYQKEKYSNFILTIRNHLKEKCPLILSKEDQIQLAEKETQRWREGKISTYEYLLYLNKYSSRTFNDLNQYYVFPWVLQCYEIFYANKSRQKKQFQSFLFPDERSDYLINEGSKEKLIFRNFEYAMGIQKEENRKEAKKKYDMILESGEGFSFYLGSHYSTSSYILYFNGRLSYFTQGLVKLQDGRLEDPNRFFSSIEHPAHIQSILGESREMIPQFYSQFDYMININCVNFGKLSDGQNVDDLFFEHPLTNISTYVNFMVNHRSILDSELVREKIHLWINFIFGVNQLNQKENSFPSNCYEEKAEIYSLVKDKITPDGNICLSDAEFSKVRENCSLVLNFGQTPSRIFSSLLDGVKKSKKDRIKRKQTIAFGLNIGPEERIEYFKPYAKGEEEYVYILTSKQNIFLYAYDKMKPEKQNKPIKKIQAILPLFMFEGGSYNFENILFTMSDEDHVISCRYPDNTIRVSKFSDGEGEGSGHVILYVGDFVECVSKVSEEKFLSGLSTGRMIEWVYDSDIGAYASERSLMAHSKKVELIIYNKSTNAIISYGSDKYIYVRKYYDFVMLSVINLSSYSVNTIKISDLNLMYLLCEEKKASSRKRNVILGYNMNGICFAKLFQESCENIELCSKGIFITYGKGRGVKLLYPSTLQSIGEVRELQGNQTKYFTSFSSKDKILLVYSTDVSKDSSRETIKDTNEDGVKENSKDKILYYLFHPSISSNNHDFDFIL